MKKLLTGFRVLAATFRWTASAGTPRTKTLHLPWLAKSIRRGDFSWPWRVSRWIRGRRVLDVGCGRNLQAIGFLGAGAESYTGLDPRLDLDSDPNDADQALVVDWAHTRLRPEHEPIHAWITKTQNRIRLDELHALVAQHFTIERWEETESRKEQGIERLTPEILARYPEFSRRDLATKCVFVVAHKSSTLAVDRPRG